MGLFDLIRRSPAAPDKGRPPTKPRGDSGRGHTHGFLDLEELNSDLQGTNGLGIYDRMFRTDGDVRGAMMMAYTPAVAAVWGVDAGGGDEAGDAEKQLAQDLAWALGLGDEGEDSPLGQQGGLPGHLAEAFPVFMRCGFAPFEITWTAAKRDGRDLLVPRKIGLRLPRTIQRWITDSEGELTELEQFLKSTGQHVLLPRQDLLYYRVGAEGDNWEGVSMLRPAYKHWYLKDKVERLDAMGQEREAVGLPVVFPPPNAAGDVLDDLETRLAQLRAGELAYLMMPGPKSSPHTAEIGWDFDIAGLGGSGSTGRSAQDTLSYHRGGIRSAFIEEFMRLGQEGEGARATADVQQDPFLLSVQALADIPRREIASWLVPRFCAFNAPDGVRRPKLTVSFTEGSLEQLQTYVGSLVGAGVLIADAPLEDFLRERGKLPPADPEARAQREAQEEEKRQAELEAMRRPEPGPGANGSERTIVKEGPNGREKTTERTRHLDDLPAGTRDAGALQIHEPVAGRECACKGDRHQDGCEHREKTLAIREERLQPFHAHMALEAYEQLLDDARPRVREAAQPHVRTYAAAAAAAAAAGKTDPPRPPAGLEHAIATVLQDLYDQGRAAVTAELASQRQPQPAPVTLEQLQEDAVALADDTGPAREIARRAAAATQAIASSVWQAVTRRHLTGVGDIAVLTAAGEREGDHQAGIQGRTHGSGAMGAGRAARAVDYADIIKGARYTSILDPNRCGECARADDGVLRTLDDPVRLIKKPPNQFCEGWDRCRCMEFFQLADEAPASL